MKQMPAGGAGKPGKAEPLFVPDQIKANMKEIETLIKASGGKITKEFHDLQKVMDKLVIDRVLIAKLINSLKPILITN